MKYNNSEPSTKRIAESTAFSKMSILFHCARLQHPFITNFFRYEDLGYDLLDWSFPIGKR